MEEANYSISHRLLNNIVKIESAKIELEHNLPNYTVRSKLASRVKALNLFHLGHCLGINITLKDAEKLAEGRKLETNDTKINVLNNFRNVLEYNRAGVGEVASEIDFNLLMHLNKIVLTDWRESWDVRFRVEGENVDNSLDNWQELRDTNLTTDQIEPALRELFDWYTANVTRLNGILLIGIMVFRLLEIMPFAAGNKLTILALVDHLMHKMGYSDKTFLPVIRNFDVHEQDYYEAWHVGKKNYDLSIWLEKFASAIAKDIQENKADVDHFLAEEEKGSKQPFLDLNKRQLKILRYLQTIPTVKREDYCQMMEVSTMTAFRDLNDLVHKKLIKIEGQGRGTKYILATR